MHRGRRGTDDFVFRDLVHDGSKCAVDGSWQARTKVEAQKPWSQTFTFRGGELAAVLAIGDHKEAGVRVQVAVFDAKATLIAEDKGEGELASDFVGLVWHPLCDGDYRIEVRDPAPISTRSTSPSSDQSPDSILRESLVGTRTLPGFADRR